jgi:DNA invertase Pin-like site-specific DNA recombinase
MMNDKKQIKICAIYGRASDQAAAEREFGTIEQQEAIGREFADGLSKTTNFIHHVKYVLIEETGLSGATTNRPKYQELLGLIRGRKINVVIAKEISRLSRSTAYFCDFMMICEEHDVAVRIRNVDVDPTTPSGKAMFGLLAVLAEFERDLVRERVRTNARSRMLNDRKINGGAVILGFNLHKDQKGVWVPNDEELAVVRMLFEKFVQCVSYRSTAEYANQLGHRTKQGKKFTGAYIKSTVTNRRYIGKLRVPQDEGHLWVDLPYGSVVSVELFEKAQKCVKLVSSKFCRSNKIQRRVYSLTGLLEYQDGTSFTGYSGTGRGDKTYNYYRNPENKLLLDASTLEKAVVKSLRVFEKDKDMTAYASKFKKQTSTKVMALKSKSREVEATLKTLMAEEDALRSKLLSNSIPNDQIIKWLEAQLRSIEVRRVESTTVLDNIHREELMLKTAITSPLSLKKSLKALFDALSKAKPEVQRGIFRKLFKKITVYKNNKLKVEWAIPVCKPQENVLLTVKDGSSGETRTPDKVINSFQSCLLLTTSLYLQLLQHANSIDFIATACNLVTPTSTESGDLLVTQRSSYETN